MAAHGHSVDHRCRNERQPERPADAPSASPSLMLSPTTLSHRQQAYESAYEQRMPAAAPSVAPTPVGPVRRVAQHDYTAVDAGQLSFRTGTHATTDKMLGYCRSAGALRTLHSPHLM